MDGEFGVGNAVQVQEVHGLDGQNTESYLEYSYRDLIYVVLTVLMVSNCVAVGRYGVLQF